MEKSKVGGGGVVPPRLASLVLRKWRSKGKVGGFSNWVLEVGSAAPSDTDGRGSSSRECGGKNNALVAESAGRNPEWHARDAFQFWEWVVTNIAYPQSTYSVTVDVESQQLVLRTANKKFFKRWSVCALRRREMRLELESVAFAHDPKSSVLTIRYRKPQSEVQREMQRERNLFEMARTGGCIPGDSGGSNVNQECAPS